MRVSAQKNSPHYDPFYQGSHVWIDGKRVDRVIEACEEAGWVIRDTDQMNAAGDGYQRQLLRGRVSIINPRMLPIVAPRRLIVMNMAGSALSLRSLMLMDWFRAQGDAVEVIQVGDNYSGWTPEAVWVDDLSEMLQSVVAVVAHRIVSNVRADMASFRRNERAWDTKRRKGH